MKFLTALQPRAILNTLAGFAIILTCYLIGLWLKKTFHFFIPGNVLGMFLLLILLATRVVKVAWVESAAKGLLFVLPMMFLPINVRAASDHELWSQWGVTLLIIAPLGVLSLWFFVGHSAQFLLKRQPGT